MVFIWSTYIVSLLLSDKTALFLSCLYPGNIYSGVRERGWCFSLLNLIAVYKTSHGFIINLYLTTDKLMVSHTRVQKHNRHN